jgi:hypothetical protein
MKKRILLSLVSFFMMTAMWASLNDAYQIYVTAGANGKTYGTAELTLNLKNRKAIATWSCTIVLPAGVTAKSVAVVDGRYPEDYNPVITLTPANTEGEYKVECGTEAEGVVLTGTEGAVATVTVEIAGTVEPGDYAVTVKDTKLTEADGTINEDKKGSREFTWTIEQGEEPGVDGDLNGDGELNISDAQTVLIGIANQYTVETYPAYDVNKDGEINISDAQTLLIWIANQG